MKRIFCLAFLLSIAFLGFGGVWAGDDKDDAKEGLAALQDFIGDWKGTGGPDKPRADPRDPTWKESVNWAWRFKGDDRWLVFEVKNGKVFKSGEVRFVPTKQKYQLTALDTEGKKQIFEGELKNDTLKFERTDPETKEVRQISMNTAAEGVRFIYRVAHKPAGSTLVKKDYLIALTKEGESLAAKEKKIECVVSGGLGTMPVSYKGETYYVCCSGCRDAFNENPEKFIAEFKAKKAGKK